MYGPVRTTGHLMLELKDDRPLSQVAKDLEGCETFRKEEGDGAYKVYEGYTDLRSIAKTKDGCVQASLAR